MKNNNKISRSKIELFIDCPRCFWLEMKYNIERPKDFAGGWIGQKYDPIIKNEFDAHRQNSTKPEKLEELGLDLFNDLERLKIWRGKGIEFYHPKHNFVYWGKIDELLIDKKSNLIPFDIKTTLSKNFQIHESYKRQLEIYGYLLLKNGEQVANYGAFYVIKIDTIKETKNSKNNEILISEERDIVLVEDLNYEKYDEILENLKEVYYSETPPAPNPTCQFCNYFEKRKEI
ncbi:MAG: PD-(D/E)XK nuclease family protein [Candidatus Omnitrophica bacterium]|nr:PD-(D/E)XK nuclease family protein [Candidatus Omnitrophota bacterium]